MQMRFWLAAFSAAALALTTIADPAPAAQKKRAAVTKKAAKKYRPVPVTMARPRTRITVTRRTFLDPGREVIPGSQHEFTDYAHPPG